MSYDLYLSYSGRKSYLTCPRQYHFRYVLKDKTRGDIRGAVFGSAIGKVFQWFYDLNLWSTPDPVAACVAVSEKALAEVLKEEDFDPLSDPGFIQDTKRELGRYVPSGVEIIRSLGLLTPHSRAEADLSVVYGNDKYGMTLKLGGRADFVHSADMHDVWIVDGKASRHREKFVDAEQLIWYAVQHYIKYHVAPTRIGFVFWSFPDDPVKWIDYDSKAMRASLDTTFEVAKKITLKSFDAVPSAECQRCPYRNKCDDGSRHVAAHRKETGGGYIENSIFDLEPVTSGRM